MVVQRIDIVLQVVVIQDKQLDVLEVDSIDEIDEDDELILIGLVMFDKVVVVVDDDDTILENDEDDEIVSDFEI